MQGPLYWLRPTVGRWEEATLGRGGKKKSNLPLGWEERGRGTGGEGRPETV